jgi:hypothetical protein
MRHLFNIKDSTCNLVAALPKKFQKIIALVTKKRLKITSVLTRVHKALLISTQGSKSQCLVNCGENMQWTAEVKECNAAFWPTAVQKLGIVIKLVIFLQGCRARLHAFNSAICWNHGEIGLIIQYSDSPRRRKRTARTTRTTKQNLDPRRVRTNAGKKWDTNATSRRIVRILCCSSTEDDSLPSAERHGVYGYPKQSATVSVGSVWK